MQMEEKIYKSMGRSGALSIAVGVVAIVTGVASGVLLLISGARLLANRSKILFQANDGHFIGNAQSLCRKK